MNLHGIFVPIATPFDYDGEVYASKLDHNLAKWNKTSVAGYVVCSAVGEGPLLSLEEQRRVFALAAKFSAPDKLLICGASAPGVRETVRRIAIAAELGYRAALVSAPAVYPLQLGNAASRALYFSAVADQSPIPTIIDSTGEAELDSATAARLSAHPNIIGLRDGSGDRARIAAAVAAAKPAFQVLSGVASTLADTLAAGASGAIADFANAAPYALITIWEAHRLRESDAALDWQCRLTPADKLVTERYGIAGLKYAMDVNGYFGGPVRLPLAGIGPQARREIEKALCDLKG